MLGPQASPEHCNFLSFLATAQALEIPFLPITWEAARRSFGKGGTSRISEADGNIETSFALKRFKRFKRNDGNSNNFPNGLDSQSNTNNSSIPNGHGSERDIPDVQIFRALTNEIIVLGHRSIREHPNIGHLQGICWDIAPDDTPWPVLVFEKSEYEDLYDFAQRPIGRAMGIDERVKLCVDIGSAIQYMHSISKWYSCHYVAGL